MQTRCNTVSPIGPKHQATRSPVVLNRNLL